MRGKQWMNDSRQQMNVVDTDECSDKNKDKDKDKNKDKNKEWLLK